jgi:hypothetical protein
MAKKKEDMTDLRTPKMISAVEAVVRDFEENKVKERKGQGGKMYKYVKAQEYIVRLNDVFGLAWSCEIVNHWFVSNHVVMMVRVHYPNPDYPDSLELREFKDGIDGHPLFADVGNSFKAAYLKAFRKAAVQIGTSLNLYGVTSDDDDDIDAGYQYQAGAPLPPNVTVVNPGQHNPAQMPPVPPGTGQAPVYSPPPTTGQGAPPVPPPSPTNHAMVPPQPQFINQGAIAPPAPPVPPIPPPLPTGNPNASAVDMSNAVGSTSGPGTPAAASVSFNSAGSGDGPIADFLVNGIKGTAITRGIQNPMDLVRQMLGDEVASLTAIEQLTSKQAQRVLEIARSIPPQ